MKEGKGIKTKGKKRLIISAAIIMASLILAAAGGSFAAGKVKDLLIKDKEQVSYTTTKAERRDIETVLSSSGTVEPLNTYNVTSLIQGEVISADFKEGDKVKKGQVLYRISTDGVDSTITSAKKAVERAEESYNETAEQLNDLTLTAGMSGKVAQVYVEEGDQVQAGSQIAKIYDSSTMLLEVPFQDLETGKQWVGKTAVVYLTGTSKKLNGKITKVTATSAGATESSGMKNESGTQSATAGSSQKVVTISVKNDGSVTTDTNASAKIGTKESTGDGTFTAEEEKIITAKSGGEISSIYIKEGESVKKGARVLTMDSSSVKKELKNCQNSIDDAQAELQEKLDSLSDYKITSNVTGKVIKKNVKEGDTISGSNGGDSTALAVIYDLSSVTFKMYIDELDIKSVKKGQTVNITADALEDVKITGKVTNVSLESTASGGVTQYPVTVFIEEPGELLPGMNVTGEIVTKKSADAVTIPVNALVRGNKVYIKDDSVKEADGDIPAGFRSVEVETGLNDGDYIEIANGIEEGDEVYVPGRSTDEKEDQMMMPGMNMDGQGQRPEERKNDRQGNSAGGPEGAPSGGN